MHYKEYVKECTVNSPQKIIVRLHETFLINNSFIFFMHNTSICLCMIIIKYLIILIYEI